MASSMPLKRLYTHEGAKEGETSVQQPKRQRPVVDAVRKVMRLQSMETLPFVIEPFLRKLVREEVEKIVLCYVNSGPRESFHQIQASTARHWQLQFMKKLPSTLFAGSKIEADEKSPMQIAIVDTFSNKIIETGHLSSLKTEILVLDGDFNGEEREDWTEKDFNANLVREREGKRPLLIGELSLTLKEGTGYFGEITFTDNSSWIRSRKFRLGVRVLQSCSNGIGIREAISGAFVVKDHRGELYKKHHHPSPGDEVWRLKKIGKDGPIHKRLKEKGINTVEDFLKLFVVNQEVLRSILGMPNKAWETTVQHARNCRLENKLYSYYNVVEQVTLYFNSIFEIVGMKFDNSCYQPFSELAVHHQKLVNRLKEFAYRNLNDMVEIYQLPFSVPRSLSIANAPCSLQSNKMDLPDVCDAVTDQDEPTTQITSMHLCNPISELPGDQFQLNGMSNMQELHSVQYMSPSTINFNSGDVSGGQLPNYETVPYTSEREGVPFLMDSNSAARMLNCMTYLHDWDPGNRLFHTSGSEIYGNQPSPIPGFSSHISPSNWVKVIATLKCGMSLRKRLAARRSADIPHVSYQMYPSFPDSF